jgi:hypothetical protein
MKALFEKRQPGKRLPEKRQTSEAVEASGLLLGQPSIGRA